MSQSIKQVIILRNDLHMNKGKCSAMSAHASLGAVLSQIERFIDEDDGITEYKMRLENNSPLNIWLDEKFTKICLQVNSEEELLYLHKQAQEAGLINCLIKDSGETYFHGVPTYTCLAIGPDFSDKIDKITGGLKLI